MQASDDVTGTHPHAPYDALRPMRCRYEFQGRACNGRGGDINWNAPGTNGFKCPKCGAFNVVHVVAAAHAE